jgi:hypothetical protein
MTEEHAKILVSSKNGQKMRARKITLGMGEDFCIYIPNKIGFFVWNDDDWATAVSRAKLERQAQEVG